MSRRRCSGAARGIWGVAILTALTTLPAMQGVASATPLETRSCDFDADGFDDQPTGIPGEDALGVADAGAVQVLYGSRAGLTAARNQLWFQDLPRIEGAASAGDRFGEAVACGDFDGDRYDDLAVGVLGDDDEATDGGSVIVIYGSSAGLITPGNQRWSQGSPDIAGNPETRDRFGAALAAGDFNADGFYELAIGAPAEKIGSASSDKLEGTVNVLYGGSSGLSANGDQGWSQATAGVAGDAEPRDLFGTSLTTGDFDADRFGDLAVGVPGEDIGEETDAGAVHVFHGSASGLGAADDRLWSQDSPGVGGAAEPHDRFGFSVVSADFDGDRPDDLAIGAPGEDRDGVHNTGIVHVLYGAPAVGLRAAGNQVWSQGTTGIGGDPEPNDRFGTALSAGRFNGAGAADLAVGAPWDSVANVREVGTVNVLYGTAAGLDDAGDQFWHQGQPGVLGGNEALDRFGDALASGDFDGDRRSDLVSGVSGEGVGDVTDAGVINVLYGTPTGLGSADNQNWHQDSPGIIDSAEPFDRVSGRMRSEGVYRIPYADETTVRVSGDRLTHSPQERLDLKGIAPLGPYLVVAAKAGTIEAIVDSNEEPTSSNNYVWISHANGEWTKYTHFVTDSVDDDLDVGDSVSAGTFLGIEGDVGKASGDHLHFEVAVPDDPADPIDGAGFIKGENRDPVICRIPGNTFVTGETYIAGPC